MSREQKAVIVLTMALVAVICALPPVIMDETLKSGHVIRWHFNAKPLWDKRDGATEIDTGDLLARIFLTLGAGGAVLAAVSPSRRTE